MSHQKVRPKWWQVFLTFPLLIVLFAVDHRLRISTRGHQVVQMGIVLLVFGLIHLWLTANATALSRMDQMTYREAITVIRIPPFQPSAEQRWTLRLPDSEIKGVLSDTFEMNFIDAEALPIDENVQETNKD